LFQHTEPLRSLRAVFLILTDRCPSATRMQLDWSGSADRVASIRTTLAEVEHAIGNNPLCSAVFHTPQSIDNTVTVVGQPHVDHVEFLVSERISFLNHSSYIYSPRRVQWLGRQEQRRYLHSSCTLSSFVQSVHVPSCIEFSPSMSSLAHFNTSYKNKQTYPQKAKEIERRQKRQMRT